MVNGHLYTSIMEAMIKCESVLPRVKDLIWTYWKLYVENIFFNVNCGALLKMRSLQDLNKSQLFLRFALITVKPIYKKNQHDIVSVFCSQVIFVGRCSSAWRI